MLQRRFYEQQKSIPFPSIVSKLQEVWMRTACKCVGRVPFENWSWQSSISHPINHVLPFVMCQSWVIHTQSTTVCYLRCVKLWYMFCAGKVSRIKSPQWKKPRTTTLSCDPVTCFRILIHVNKWDCLHQNLTQTRWWMPFMDYKWNKSFPHLHWRHFRHFVTHTDQCSFHRLFDVELIRDQKC